MARTVKYSKDLNNKRTLEKFEIERVYWQNREISWSIITEKDVNPIIVDNIKSLHSYRNLQYLPSEITPQIVQQYIQLVRQSLINEPLLCEVIENCSSTLKISRKTSLAVFYYLVANHCLKFDVTQSINPKIKVYPQNSNIGGGL